MKLVGGVFSIFVVVLMVLSSKPQVLNPHCCSLAGTGKLKHVKKTQLRGDKQTAKRQEEEVMASGTAKMPFCQITGLVGRVRR